MIGRTAHCDSAIGSTDLKAEALDADLTLEVRKLRTVLRQRLATSVESVNICARAASIPTSAREDGDVILGWLTRIVVAISIVAVVGFDALSIGVAHVSAIDDANSAASAASAAWHADPRTLTAAVNAAEGSASQHGETVVPQSLRVAADGTVRLKLERDATTLLVKHLSPLRPWANVVVSGSGRYVSP